MSVPVELILQLLSPDPKNREQAADMATDSCWSTGDATLLCRALIRCVLAEANAGAREAQLHALGSLVFSVPSLGEFNELLSQSIDDPNEHLETVREAVGWYEIDFDNGPFSSK